MTKFIKEEFIKVAGYVHYNADRNGERFVCRNRVASHSNPFITFLIKNFTVEEYFALRGKGIAPLTILQTKGYISPNMRKVLKAANLPMTLESVATWAKTCEWEK
jgi:hypothetical protein